VNPNRRRRRRRRRPLLAKLVVWMHPVIQDMYVFHSDESKMAGGNVGWCVCDWQKAGTGGA
jgi:hypothetical protein